MPRINPIDPAKAEGPSRTLLDGVGKSLGKVPNLMRTLAHSPAALDAYLGFGRALGKGRLPASLREQIAVAVSGANSCEYCTAAHSTLGRQLGLSDQEMIANLHGFSDDPKIGAALDFARRIVTERGWVSDDDLKRVRDAGWVDAEIVEIIATVAITTFTNYFNHIAKTDVDFPALEVQEPQGA